MISVVVFQPIGLEGPWAVLEAKSDLISISHAPGAELSQGSTVYASGIVLDHAHALLGYHASAVGCGETGTTTGFEKTNNDAGTDLPGDIFERAYVRGQLDLSLSPQDGSCTRQPGYVFIAVTQQRITTTDPLAGLSSDVGVLAFAAVPATFRFPSAPEAAPPPSTLVPTPPSSTSSTGDDTYTSALGFEVDVPSGWSTTDQTDELIVSAPGGDPYVQIVRVPDAPLQDDSSFPLSYAAMASNTQAHFRGDGQTYIIQWLTGDGSAPTSEQVADFERITSSIAFPATKLGEAVNGFMPLGPVLESASAEWVTDKLTGLHYVAALTDGGLRAAFGPAPMCPGGVGSYEVRETDVAAITCPDGSGGDWDFTTGQPKAGNSTGFDLSLHDWPAVRSWDGWLLVRFPTGQAPSPSPP